MESIDRISLNCARFTPSFRSIAIDRLLRLTAAKFSLNADPLSVEDSGGQLRMP
jgi:hypothetical protein